MELPALNEKDLSPYFNKPELIRQAAEQLQRDMDRSGFEIHLPDDPLKAYDDLFVQVEPVIRRLIHKNYEELLQLLYCIDVSEKLVAEAVRQDTNVSHAITRLVLFRELQKVVIRNFYSK